MIEVNVARTGDKIATRDGKYICSRVDPWREARGWLDFHAEQIKFAESIIVVGLGCGYHISSLHTQYPNKKIVVIEPESELIKLFEANFPIDSSGVTCLNLQLREQVQSDRVVRECVRRPYSVLEFKPAMSLNSEVYYKLSEFLLGRSESSLEWILNQRGLLKSLEQKKIQICETSNAPYSLKSLKIMIDENKICVDEAFNRKVQLLCELIK